MRAYSPAYKQFWRRAAAAVNLVHSRVQRRTEVKLLEEQEMSDEGGVGGMGVGGIGGIGGGGLSAAAAGTAGSSPSPHHPTPTPSSSSSSSSSSMHQGMTIKPGEANTWMMQQMQQQAR